MSAEIVPTEGESKKVVMKYQGGSDSVYGLGLIGAWVFYIGRAKTIQEGVLGFFKGILWPAFLVYEVLVILNQDKSE